MRRYGTDSQDSVRFILANRAHTSKSVGKSAAPRRKAGRGRPVTPFLRERILQSASEFFAEKEFELVRIDEIAAQAGVGKGSVYRQFESKEELYATVVIDGFAELQRGIAAALAGCDSVSDQIATICTHTLKFFWTRRQFFALLRDPQALPPSQESRYREQRHNLSMLIGRVLDDAIKTGALRHGLNTQIAAEALLGMMRGVNRYGRDHVTPEQAAAIVATIFLRGCEAK